MDDIIMTEALSKVFALATKLPEELQNDIAKQLMEDIEGELQWDNTLARSQDQLAKLANQALEEFKSNLPGTTGFKFFQCLIS